MISPPGGSYGKAAKTVQQHFECVIWLSLHAYSGIFTTCAILSDNCTCLAISSLISIYPCRMCLYILAGEVFMQRHAQHKFID